MTLEDRVFTRRNVSVMAALWFAGYATLLARFFVRYRWPYYPKEFSTGCVDFGWVWLSGHLAALHMPSMVFDFASFANAQEHLFGRGNCTTLWPLPYPPTLLFFTYPFGSVSFVAGYVLWTVALLVVFAGAIYAISRRAAAALAAPATFPAIVNIYIGQTAFLSAGLFGFALTTLERRPVLAGFLISLLTFKPQFGVMLPIALVASRNWRALASATVFSIALAAAAALAFGAQGWISFFSNLLHRDQTLSPDAAFPLHLASVYGIAISAGLGTSIAWAAHLAVTLALAAAVWVIWSRPTPYSLRAALLCVASLAASPYVLYYDLSLLTIPFVFTVSDGLQRGFLPFERTTLFICWEAFSVGQSGALIAGAILLWVVYRRLVVLTPGAIPTTVRHARY